MDVQMSGAKKDTRNQKVPGRSSPGASATSSLPPRIGSLGRRLTAPPDGGRDAGLALGVGTPAVATARSSGCTSGAGTGASGFPVAMTLPSSAPAVVLLYGVRFWPSTELRFWPAAPASELRF